MRTALLVAVTALLCCAVSATAATLITGKQVKDESLTGADIKNRSLTPADFRGSLAGPAGPIGPQGVPGPAGPTGAAGPPAGLFYGRAFASATIPGGGTESATAECAHGTAVGGFHAFPQTGATPPEPGVVLRSAPSGTRWTLLVANPGENDLRITLTAVCLDSRPF